MHIVPEPRVYVRRPQSRRGPLLVAALIAAAPIVACGGDSVEPSKGGTPAKPAATTEPGPGAGGGAGGTAPPIDADAAAPGIPVPPPTNQPPQDLECDLRGRWLVAQRVLATALGQEQAAHNWFYLEVRHEGKDVTLTKGLHCGFEVIKKTSLGASVDTSGAWPSLLARASSTGRRGTYVKEGTSCKLGLGKDYVVRGATVPHYLAPTEPLPRREKPAAAGSPGWEDWDGDGNPGISLKVTSTLAAGTLYVVQRDWTLYLGTTPQKVDKFQVAITYGGEQVALGRSAGAPQAIETGSAPSSDLKQHYAWFHKLAANQAVGSDTEACAAVRALKDQLVPEANQ